MTLIVLLFITISPCCLYAVSLHAASVLCTAHAHQHSRIILFYLYNSIQQIMLESMQSYFGREKWSHDTGLFKSVKPSSRLNINKKHIYLFISIYAFSLDSPDYFLWLNYCHCKVTPCYVLSNIFSVILIINKSSLIIFQMKNRWIIVTI